MKNRMYIKTLEYVHHTNIMDVKLAGSHCNIIFRSEMGS